MPAVSRENEDRPRLPLFELADRILELDHHGAAERVAAARVAQNQPADTAPYVHRQRHAPAHTQRGQARHETSHRSPAKMKL